MINSLKAVIKAICWIIKHLAIYVLCTIATVLILTVCIQTGHTTSATDSTVIFNLVGFAFKKIVNRGKQEVPIKTRYAIPLIIGLAIFEYVMK